MRVKINKGLINDEPLNDKAISLMKEAIEYSLNRTGYGDTRRFARAILWYLQGNIGEGNGWLRGL